MTDNFTLPFMKSDILNSDIGNLNDAGILKVIFKNLMKAEKCREIHLNEDEKLKAVKSLSTKLKLTEDNLQILEKKDPGFQIRFKNEAIIQEKTEILYRDVYLEKAEIYFADNFLSKYECSYLIKKLKTQLRPSELSGLDGDQLFRTSKTCDLSEFDDSIVSQIDDRICTLLNIDPKFSEPIQAQYYKVGQEFKPHTDFFEDYELKKFEIGLGQRTYTVMIYLNTVEIGGETNFPHLELEFSPLEGKALIWNNLNHDFSKNYFTMHHAKKVKEGYKAILTKWFRVGK